MPFSKGNSGNPGGQLSQKPFRDALRMELAAAGTDHKALRRVAWALINKANGGDVSAIIALVDRIDGKVPQPTGQSDELGPTRLHISWRGAGEPRETITTVSSPLLIAPPEDKAER